MLTAIREKRILDRCSCFRVSLKQGLPTGVLASCAVYECGVSSVGGQG